MSGNELNHVSDVKLASAYKLLCLANKINKQENPLTANQKKYVASVLNKVAEELESEEKEDESIKTIIADLITKKSKFTKAIGNKKITTFTKELPQINKMTVNDIFKALEAVLATF